VAPVTKPICSVQVRELVEFALRRGDLGGQGDFVGPNRALAGTRGHQRLQRSRPAGYQKEVRISFDVESAGLILRIQGRIDGLRDGSMGRPPMRGNSRDVLLEEIKTVQAGWDGVADPLHWAQAKIYGFIYAQTSGLQSLTIQLTYLNLETGKVTELREDFLVSELSVAFQAATSVYLEWLQAQCEWFQQRDESVKKLSFPFPDYRPGQRKMAVAAYHTLVRGGRLFLEAPTGIGKTLSVLFPAIKALGESKLERVFYLTARTVGRSIAEKALSDLRQVGVRLRTLTLTAKEKICAQAGQPCDSLACPLARGYYERRIAALREALHREEITRPILEEVSRNHQVCPFELSLELSGWVDVVICDYNYVFDPKVYLRRHFSEEAREFAFLVDEAHNLVDRARDMFSADLEGREIQEVRRALGEAVPRCARALSRLSTCMRRLGGSVSGSSGKVSRWLSEGPGAGNGQGETADHPELFPSENQSGVLLPSASPGGPFTTCEFPAGLLPPLESAIKEAEMWLARNQPADFREQLLGLYFRMYSFLRTAQLYDERYVTITQPGRFPRVRLFCLDPSFLLLRALARGKAAVFFSATLTPVDYYRMLLGGKEEDTALRLASPFPPEHLAVLIHDGIPTQLKARAESVPDVVEAIRALVQGRAGNYLVYLPSYQYLTTVREHFNALAPAVPTLVQQPGMSEVEREAFLNAFAKEHGETLVGFAVMGGVFGEGIDLVGDRLIGAVIVGVGLPQLGLERDLIRDYFCQRGRSGFDYAYTFPGMNRVLQATGRVIRSERDRGVILLIDTRFGERRYRRLFPLWWKTAFVRNVSDIGRALRDFWGHGSG